MKKFLVIITLLTLVGVEIQAQKLSRNVELISNWFDASLEFNGGNNTYNEVWGFVWKDREYGVIGARSGTYIIDVTDPFYPKLVEFIEGTTGDIAINRDYDSYKGHLYLVTDQGDSAKLQIVDFTSLPDTVKLVYEENALIARCHNIFIDTVSARLYACTATENGMRTDLRILDISEPAKPELLLNYDAIDVFHDIFVRNDTAFGNNAREGMFVYDFTDLSRVKVIGAVIDYPEKGYNHSGWMTEDSRYYFFADETHGSDIKVCDVRNIDDIEVVATFNSGTNEQAMVHNLIVKGDYLYVSYYHDGLLVYNISDPVNPVEVGFYDTYPPDDYIGGKGAWGVYPFLPSGNIMVSDRERGLFVFDVEQALGVDINIKNENLVDLYPNPFQTDLTLSVLDGQTVEKVRIYDVNGREVWNGKPQNNSTIMTFPGIGNLTPGVYVVQVEGININLSKKLIKSFAP